MCVRPSQERGQESEPSWQDSGGAPGDEGAMEWEAERNGFIRTLAFCHPPQPTMCLIEARPASLVVCLT